MVDEKEIVLPPFPKAMTVITVEEKNMLADETNPTLLKSLPPKPSGLYEGHKLPRNFISIVKSRINRADERRLNVICLPIILIWLFIASFFAGLLFYRYFSREPTFYGWCGTHYVEQGRQEKIEQKLEISPDELYEKIQVPKFGLNRPAVFVHDFRKNFTAIVDVLGDRCFIKELDRTLVAPPKNFIDLIEKMEKVVPRRTNLVGGKLSIRDLTDMDSLMINRHCIGREVYLLVRSSKSLESPFFIRDKRESRQEIQFSVMNGNNVEIEKIFL
uniref:Integral membrane protein 2 n=1 Tax=Acrobeloides nanus TaxID=290746 RepID=A0A914DN82_9BILA